MARRSLAGIRLDDRPSLIPGHRVLRSGLKILDALGVEDGRWIQIMTIAREAGERGWWESARGMGERQALYANLETGAAEIREYQQRLLPGLLQTPEYSRAQVQADASLQPLGAEPESAVAGRAGRQRMRRRPGGPRSSMRSRSAASPPRRVWSGSSSAI